MKKRTLVVVFAFLLALLLMQQFTAKAAPGEKAWFPLSVMSIDQIAYDSFSHEKFNAIDCGGSSRLFAPFTGKIVKVSRSLTSTFFQSKDKVYYADGTYDYMTVQIKHGSNYKELVALKGKTIPQGKGFYNIGGTDENGKADAYPKHYEILVLKGKVTAYSDSKSKYAFDAFFVNRSETEKIYKVGTVGSKEKILKGNVTTYAGKWKSLTSSTAPSTLAISDVSYPATLAQGKGFNVKGKITSNYNIDFITVGVYSKPGGTGTKYTRATASLQKTSYNLASLDAKVLFNAVTAGTRYYYITARDASGKVVTKEYEYTVTTAASTLAISDVSYPTSLPQGKAFTVKGNISSNYNIDSVTVGIYSQPGGAGTKYTEATASPKKTSYSLASLDAKVLFNVVPAGTRYYYITAKDASGKVIKKEYKYTVTKAASTLAISDVSYPTTLKKGQPFTVKGKITSNYYITSVTVGIYSQSGGAGTKYTVATASPQKTSYSLASLDAKVLFNVVTAGTRYYYITATDASGKVIKKEYKYTVTK